MGEIDNILKADPEYLAGLQRIVSALGEQSGSASAAFHPEVGTGSFISGALFSLGTLGTGPTLSLGRTEILACQHRITSEVQRKIDAFLAK
jgi:hypothetical protein